MTAPIEILEAAAVQSEQTHRQIVEDCVPGVDGEQLTSIYSFGVPEIDALRATGLLRGILSDGAVYARFNPTLDFKWSDPNKQMDTKDPEDLQNLERAAIEHLGHQRVKNMIDLLKPILLGIPGPDEGEPPQTEPEPEPEPEPELEPEHSGCKFRWSWKSSWAWSDWSERADWSELEAQTGTEQVLLELWNPPPEFAQGCVTVQMTMGGVAQTAQWLRGHAHYFGVDS